MQPARALWHVSDGRSELRDFQLPDLLPGQVLVRSRYSLISAGTERLVATGQVPSELEEIMAVPYQEGVLTLPVKYGYSLVGEVIAGARFEAGQWVHLLHPHQDFAVVQALDLFPVPDSIPPQRAVLASNLETALNAVWDGGAAPGERIAIVGFGLIGALCAHLCRRIPGTEVLVAEPDPGRAAMAQKLGFEVESEEPPRGAFDLAIHCSATAVGLQSAIETVAFEGRVVELSWYGEKQVDLALGGSFHYQRKQIISSQVSNLPDRFRGRWDYRRRKEAVFRLLEDDFLDQLDSEQIRFQDLPAWFDQLRAGKTSSLVSVVNYG